MTNYSKDQTPVVQSYPVDNAIGFLNTCPLDDTIQCLNNWGQDM